MEEKTTIETEETSNNLRKQFIQAGSILVVLVMLAMFVFPMDYAYAGETVNFGGLIGSLRTLTTVVLLPVGILIAGWRIAYLAIFCAMAGIDPLGIMENSGRSNDGSISTGEAVAAIKQHLIGFVKGLCWVGGVWIVFQIALTLAATLAGTLDSLN